MSVNAYECSDLTDAGAGRRLRCLLRPTLGKKLFLVFAALAVTGVANWLAVDAALASLRGTTALVNVTGSLRWLGQRIEVETLRFERGDAHSAESVDANLQRLDTALAALERGGTVQGIAVPALPPRLELDIAAARLAGDELARQARRALAGLERRQDVGGTLALLHVAASNLLAVADVIAAALTRDAQEAEARATDTMLKLGLLDLAILVATLLAFRRRAVLPLRRLASVSRRFAAGQRGARSGFRSRDEIGQLAAAFDGMADKIGDDLRQLAQGKEELERSEQDLRRFALAVEQSPVSVVITDAEGTITYVNPKFGEITGYAREEVLGRNPSLFKSGQTPPAVYAELWRKVRAGREWRGELLNRKKDGTLFWEDTRIAPVRDGEGNIAHFVAVKEDISLRKQTEAAAANLNAELERRVAERTRQLVESNRELEAFSYSISHDLRAPLRGINGFASLMAEGCGGCAKTESREFLKRIQSASVRMGSLIDDLLDLSRVVRKEIAPEPLDLGEMARSILAELAAAGPKRRVEIAVEGSLDAVGDATLLRAALENLLGNAWKFTAQRDPACIAFGCRAEGGERVFFVRDNGAGFDMKYADKLFGAFQRLHGPQEFEGNGIGLAMVRRIVALHGGRIWAEGAPGAGATFHFTLGDGASAKPAPEADGDA